MVQGDDLSGLDVPDIGGADQFERAGLAADDISVSQTAERQGLDAIFVAGGIDPVLGHDDESETAFHHIQGADDAEDTVLTGILLDQVGQQFAVRPGLEDRAHLLQIIGDILGIHEVAVSGDREVPGIVMEEKGLDIVQSALRLVGVLHAADADLALEAVEDSGIEHFIDQSERTVTVTLFALESHDAGSFLPAVLQGMETVIDDCGRLLDAICSENAHLTCGLKG